MGLHRAVQPVAVGERQPGEPELDRLEHQLLGVRGSLEEGVVGAADQLGVHATDATAHPFRWPEESSRAIRCRPWWRVPEVLVFVVAVVPVVAVLPVDPALEPPLPAGAAEEPVSTRYTPEVSRGAAPGTR
jgi:hypothetical protein